MDQTYVTVATVFLTGMRRSEVLGLRWQDIDWEKDQIKVRQGVHWKGTKDRDSETPPLVFSSPKTESSRQRIDMSPRLRKILREYQIASSLPILS